MRVRNDERGPLTVFGQTLAPNEVGEFTDEQATQLVAHPHIQVSVLGMTVHREDAKSVGDTTTKRRR